MPDVSDYFTYQVSYDFPGNNIIVTFYGNVDFGDAEFTSYIDALASLPFISNLSAIKYDTESTTEVSQYMP
ncbi:hypothetical protein ABZ714_14405 [Streptomyces sp. NPDC006798]|uniref:hypothetical protein n=1 Tax=Streptomyces sp. NPDC006798 TaxID=3155462 RepID=UPI0033CABCE2